MTRRRGPAKKIQDLLKKVENKLKADDIKFTVGDYLRLLQAQQEFDRETPRDIEVTWIDSLAATSENDG
jgi:hypothetical protein